MLIKSKLPIFFDTRESFGFFILQKIPYHLRISEFKTALAIALYFTNARHTCVRSTQCLSAVVNIFQATPARLVKALQRTDCSISIYTFNSLELFL